MEQYQSRLHDSTENYEELNYVKQILASSLFQQFRNEGGASLSHHDNEIAQAVGDALSGIETIQTDDGHFSPAEKHKRQLHRKQSLKALRNAVLTKNTSGSSLEVGSPSIGGGGGAVKLAPSENLKSRVGVAQDMPPAVMPTESGAQVNGMDIPHSTDVHSTDPAVYPSEDTSLGSRSMGSTGAKLNSLSGSSSWLDKSYQESTEWRGFEGLSNRSKQKSSLSGSQPNISMLRITSLGSLEFDELPIPDTASAEIGVFQPRRPRVSVTGLPVATVASAATTGGKKLTLSPISPPTATSRPPPPSYTSYMAHNHTPDPPIPSSAYGANSANPKGLNRRAKSYEKLLEADSNFPSPPLIPLAKPMTDGVTTKDVLTTERRKTSLVIRLNKGTDGLGFRLKGLKKEQNGGLYIQDLQVGAPAERFVWGWWGLLLAMFRLD